MRVLRPRAASSARAHPPLGATVPPPPPGPFNTTYKTVTGLVEHHEYAFQIFAGMISDDGITIDWDPAAHQRLVKTLIKRTPSWHRARGRGRVDPVADTRSADPIQARCASPGAQRRAR